MAACTSSSPLGTLMSPALMTETSGTFFCAAQKAMALSRSPAKTCCFSPRRNDSLSMAALKYRTMTRSMRTARVKIMETRMGCIIHPPSW